MGVVVLETFAGIVRVSPGHISLGRGALCRSSVCFDVTRGKGEGGGGGGMCRVLLSISSCEWWLLNQFVALVYLESVLTISGHPNRVSIIVGWCCVRVCVVVSVVGWLCCLERGLSWM